MNLWPLIILLIPLSYFLWSIYGLVLLNKKILVKRIDSQSPLLVGDLTIKEDKILIRFKWKVKIFTFQQIEEIKVYSYTDWGLSDYELVEIKFEKNHQITLDGTLEEHQKFTNFLVLQLGIKNKILDWGFLPQLNDKMKRDIIFEKSMIN